MSELSLPEKSSERHSSRKRCDPVGPYILGKTLGKGTTGKVRVGVHKDTGMEVAVKIVRKDNVKSHKQKILREIAVMRLLEHPHIMKLYDVHESKNHYFMVLEWVKGGELFDYIVQRGKLPRKEALRILSQCVQALEYCHQHSICHRDLKPENLLLDDNLNIKIADFGYANIIPDGGVLKTFCGSPHYGAPEVVSGIKYDGRHSDVWSLGVVFYALVTGMLPFDHPEIHDLLRLVKKAHYSIPAWVDPDIKDLLRWMLCPDITKRIRTDQIRQHPCFKNQKADINLYFPAQPMPSPALQYMRNNPIRDASDIDTSIVTDMEGLGWGTSAELSESLLLRRNVSLHNLEYVFYCMLAARNVVRLKERRKIERSVDEADELEDELLTLNLREPNSPATPNTVANSHRATREEAGEVAAAADDNTTSPRKQHTKKDKSSSKKKPLKISVTKGSGDNLESEGNGEQPHSGNSDDGRKQVCTTPRFHRLRLDTSSSPPSPTNAQPVTPSGKRSWFKKLFIRRPSLDIASKQQQQKGASGLYSSSKPIEIREQVEKVLTDMGVNMKVSSHSDYELKCAAYCHLDERFRIVIRDKAGKLCWQDDEEEKAGTSAPRSVPAPAASNKDAADPYKPQIIKFIVDISREPNDKVSCLNFNQRSGNTLVYRGLYTDIIKQLDIQ